MSSQQSKPGENECIEIYISELARKIKKTKEIKRIFEQIDCPDGAIIIHEKGNEDKILKKIGIEVVSLDNSDLLEDMNVSKRADKQKEAWEKVENGESSYPVNQTTKTFSKEQVERLNKKFGLYTKYLKDFDDCVLLIHSQSLGNDLSYEALRIEINHYCCDNQCPYSEVHLFNSKNTSKIKYVGIAYEKKGKLSKKFGHSSQTKNIVSATVVQGTHPVNKEVKIFPD